MIENYSEVRFSTSVFENVIFVPLQHNELLIISGGIFTQCACFLQKTSLSIFAERGSWHFFYTCHVCRTFTASSWYVIFFSLQLPSHISTTHLLSSELSIPNRLTGLWQEMLVDLLGALCSSRACLTCIFLETISSFPSLISLSL